MFPQSQNIAPMLTDHLRYRSRWYAERRRRAGRYVLKERLRPAPPQQGAHKLSEGRMIGTGHGVSSREILRRVQPQADHRDLRRFKKRQKLCAKCRRFLYRVFLIITAE